MIETLKKRFDWTPTLKNKQNGFYKMFRHVYIGKENTYVGMAIGIFDANMRVFHSKN
jgi:hypothetical protein